ncbi:MAG: hypothetical protein GY838_18015 [bacterium]|nr:hypothetical protein [bacterium]
MSDFQNDFNEQSADGLSLPPWEQRENYGYLNATYLTVKGVMLSPAQFFHRMPARVGLAQPLFFAVVLGVIASFFSWMWALSGSSLQVLVEEDMAGAMKGPFVGFIVFLTSPVTAAITVAINAALTHLVLMLVGGNRLGFEATFRVAAYAMATSILAVVPFCGSTVGALWSVAVMIIGLYSIHETEPWKAIVAVLAPTLLCLMATGSAVGLLFFSLAG